MKEPETVTAVPQQQLDGRISLIHSRQLNKNISEEVVYEREEEEIEQVGGPEGLAHSDYNLQERKNYGPLDGGYGWVVVFGCFLMHVVNVGLIKSFGIVVVDLREKFNASSYDTSWIYSLFLVCSTWFAPLASFLANAFSQRSVVMLGGLMLGVGISLAYFANSLMFLYFSYGCLSGLGSAFAYTPAVVCVGSYFDKKRALANGISLSGAAFGSITVSGAILICGSIALNVCVAGALLRPISTHMKILRIREQEAQVRTRRLLEAAAAADQHLSGEPKAFSQPPSARSNGLNSLFEREPESHGRLLGTPWHDEGRKRSSHSVRGDVPNSVRSNIHELPVAKQISLTISQRFTNRFKRKEGQPPLFDFGLFRQRLFIVYASAVMLSTFAYMNIFLILPAHTVDLGYSRKRGADLVALIGLADIFARIGYGWFSDLKLFHRKWGFCLAIYAASACNFLVFFARTDITLAVYAVFLGLTSGSYISLVAVVCVDFFGIDRLSSALGSVIAFQGAAFLAGPPLIGYVKDQTGSYNIGFFILAVCLVCAASLIVLEHFVGKMCDRKPLRMDLEKNHEMSQLKLHSMTNSVSSPLVPSIPNSSSFPPIAHMDEFDPLTPRPVSKPVFKPKLKRHLVKERINRHSGEHS